MTPVEGTQIAVFAAQTSLDTFIALVPKLEEKGEGPTILTFKNSIILGGTKHENDIRNWRGLYVVPYDSKAALAIIIDSSNGNSKVFALMSINQKKECLEKLLSIPISMSTMSQQGIFKRTENDLFFLMVDYNSVAILDEKFQPIETCKVMTSSIIDFAVEVRGPDMGNDNKTMTLSEVKDKDEVHLAIVDDACQLHYFIGHRKCDEAFIEIKPLSNINISILETEDIIRKEVFMSFIEGEYLYIMAVYQREEDDDENDQEDDGDLDDEDSTGSDHKPGLTYSAKLFRYQKKDKKLQTLQTDTNELQDGINNLDRLKVNLTSAPKQESTSDKKLYVICNGPAISSCRVITLKKKKKGPAVPETQLLEFNKKLK